MSEFQEGILSDLVACDLIRLDDRRRAGPRNLAEELDFLDAYGYPFPDGTLETLIDDSESDPGSGRPADAGHCQVIYWQFHVPSRR